MSHQKPGGPGEGWHASNRFVFGRLSILIIGQCVNFLVKYPLPLVRQVDGSLFLLVKSNPYSLAQSILVPPIPTWLLDVDV